MNNDHVLTGVDEECLEEPRNTETNEEIKDIGPDSVADRHVCEPLLHHRHPGQRVLDTDRGSHEGEAHDGVGDGEGVADDGDHPDQDVAVQADPEDGHDEAEDEVS